MKWSICLSSYNNVSEVYFTVQALRMYHDMADKEIVVVDNFGDDILAKFCREKGGSIVRYERYTEIQGTAASRDRLFKIAKAKNA